MMSGVRSIGDEEGNVKPGSEKLRAEWTGMMARGNMTACLVENSSGVSQSNAVYGNDQGHVPGCSNIWIDMILADLRVDPAE